MTGLAVHWLVEALAYLFPIKPFTDHSLCNTSHFLCDRNFFNPTPLCGTVDAYNPSTREAEEGRLQVWGKAELHRELETSGQALYQKEG